MNLPTLIKGGIHRDPRGAVSFVNDFDMQGVRRCYCIENSVGVPFRGWTGHRFERKWFLPVIGTTTIAVVKVDDFEHPSAQLRVESYRLSADEPAVLALPAGYAIGIRSVTIGSKVMVFSDKTLAESKNDQLRWPEAMWEG